MNSARRHRWDLTPAQVAEVQRALAARVSLQGPLPAAPFLVAGCDAAGVGRWARRDERIVAAILVFRWPRGELVDAAAVRVPSAFPYVPGLLSFREAPAYLEAWHALRARPDVLLCDGQGIAHPRGLGLAAHLGVRLEIPAIGVAKSRLVGCYREPGRRRGCATRLLLGRRVVGRVLRTQDGVRPLYVSPGHRCGVDEAAALVLRLAPRHRLPAPTRLADAWVARLRVQPDAPPPASLWGSTAEAPGDGASNSR